MPIVRGSAPTARIFAKGRWLIRCLQLLDAAGRAAYRNRHDHPSLSDYLCFVGDVCMHIAA